jgi:hypothetical protein
MRLIAVHGLDDNHPTMAAALRHLASRSTHVKDVPATFPVRHSLHIDTVI